MHKVQKVTSQKPNDYPLFTICKIKKMTFQDKPEGLAHYKRTGRNVKHANFSNNLAINSLPSLIRMGHPISPLDKIIPE